MPRSGRRVMPMAGCPGGRRVAFWLCAHGGPEPPSCSGSGGSPVSDAGVPESPSETRWKQRSSIEPDRVPIASRPWAAGSRTQRGWASIQPKQPPGCASRASPTHPHAAVRKHARADEHAQVLPRRRVHLGDLLGRRKMSLVPDHERELNQYHDDEQNERPPPPRVHLFQEERCPAEPDDGQDDFEAVLKLLGRPRLPRRVGLHGG